MTKLLQWEQIEAILPHLDLTSLIAEGFEAYSAGQVVVPPIGELLFENPPGDTHIKYGYIKEDEYFVIKVASGFYDNPKLGLSSSQGLMLVFSQKTGQVLGILVDHGKLTDIRTAVAGLCAAQCLAPKIINGIGIIGTGIQARMQLDYLLTEYSNPPIWVWGRTEKNVVQFIKNFENQGAKVSSSTPSEICSKCNLIVTTTPSTKPLLQASDVISGRHITAVGSDTSEKNEIAPGLFKKIDKIVADSISQCKTRGETHHALSNNMIEENQVIELGNILSGKEKGRSNDQEITLVDLTGVAVQDIQIAKAVFESHSKYNI